jgi:hypothetical protein
VDERIRNLESLTPSGTPQLEKLLEAFLRPALAVGAEHGATGRIFVKLRARLATGNTALSKKIVMDAFDRSSTMNLQAIVKALPDIPPSDVYWRFHFLMGAMVFTMVNPGRIQSMTDGQCDPGDIDEVMRQIVPFLAAGFRSSGDNPSLSKSVSPPPSDVSSVEALNERISVLEKEFVRPASEKKRKS